MKKTPFYRLLSLNLAILMALMIPFSAFAATDLDLSSAIALSEGKTMLTPKSESLYVFTTPESEGTVQYQFCCTTSASLTVYNNDATEMISCDKSYYGETIDTWWYSECYDYSFDAGSTYYLLINENGGVPFAPFIKVTRYITMKENQVYSGNGLKFVPAISGYYTVSGMIDSITVHQMSVSPNSEGLYYFSTECNYTLSGTDVRIDRALACEANYFEFDASIDKTYPFVPSETAWYELSTNVPGGKVQVYYENELLTTIGTLYQLEAGKTYHIKATDAEFRPEDNMFYIQLLMFTPLSEAPGEIPYGAFSITPTISGFYSFKPEYAFELYEFHISGVSGYVSRSFENNADECIYYLEKDNHYFFEWSGGAVSYLEPGYRYELNENGDGYITAYYGLDSAITIPTEIEGISIKGISGGAFWGHPLLQSVTVLNNVKHIGSRAFFNCKNLSEIILPEGLHSLGAQIVDETAYSNFENGFNYIGNYVVARDYSCHYYIARENAIFGDGIFYYMSKIGGNFYFPKSVTFLSPENLEYADHIFFEGAAEEWGPHTIGETTVIHYGAKADDVVVKELNSCGIETAHLCTLCNEIIAQKWDGSEDTHILGELIVDTPASCVKSGVGHKICTVCGVGVEGNITIPATGNHTPGDWQVTDSPSVNEEGVETQFCTVCGAVLNTRPIEKLPPAPSFTDVAADAYYSAPVQWAVEKGITTGTSASTFSPGNTCSRAQIVTFLWRAAGCPEPASDAMPFTDVPANAYYYKAVQWAVEKNITTGTSATTFSPGKNCSRGQIVTFLWRAEGAEKTEGANPFGDVAENAYYADAVLWAVEKNITTGTSATSFSAGNACTRGQIVTFLYRCYN